MYIYHVCKYIHTIIYILNLTATDPDSFTSKKLIDILSYLKLTLTPKPGLNAP